jgi:hypothetical protein
VIVNVEGLSWESIVLDGSDKLVDDLDQDDCAPAPLVKRWRGREKAASKAHGSRKNYAA